MARTAMNMKTRLATVTAIGVALLGWYSLNRVEATEPAPQSKRAIRLAYFPNVTHAVALVGSANGAFARAVGPNVQIQEQTFNAGPAEIEALFAGQVDVGYVGPGPALNGFLKSRGKALRIIAGA